MTTFNYLESGLWFVLAVILWIRSSSNNPKLRPVGRLSAVAFFIFGISDVIEAGTGAWWEPRWLLILKVLCVLTLVGCLRRYLALKRTGQV